MLPVKIKNSNHCFGKPTDWDVEKVGEECGALHVFVQQDQRNGLQQMTSVWMPTPDELAALNSGHGVMLTVYGPGHPAVMLGVTGDKYNQQGNW